MAGAPISVMEGYDETEEAQLVLREVASLTRPANGGKARYRLGDIAVMYRVNAQSRAFEESCLRHGVPYQVVGGMKFYQRQEVKDLAAYLKPGRQLERRRQLGTGYQPAQAEASDAGQWTS